MSSDLGKRRVDPPQVRRYIPLRSERFTRPDGETGRGAGPTHEGRETGQRGVTEPDRGRRRQRTGTGRLGSRPAVRPQGHAAGRASQRWGGSQGRTRRPTGGAARRLGWGPSPGGAEKVARPDTRSPAGPTGRRQRRSVTGGGGRWAVHREVSGPPVRALVVQRREDRSEHQGPRG